MAYYEVGLGDFPGDTYTLYLDPQTRLVAAVLYTVTFGRAYEPAPTTSGTVFDYQEYTMVDGLTVPTRFGGYSYREGVQDDLRNEDWASEISFSQPFDPSRLAMPADGRIEP